MDNPFERQFEPSYFPQEKQGGGRLRSTSAASEQSATSSRSYSPEPESQFILSMGNTPVVETPPPQPMARHGPVAATYPMAPNDSRRLLDAASDEPPRPPNRNAVSERLTNSIKRSRPITIELPPPRRVNTAPDRDNIAPEHLSARGDIPGGFFPDHGDKQMRFYQPHPFHKDVQRARDLSISQAAAECKKSPEKRERDAAAPAHMSNPAEFPVADALGHGSKKPAAPGSANTIASYNPLGDHGSPVPTGKYYPTNWENRKRAKGKAKVRPPVSAPATIQTEADMPKYRPVVEPLQLRLDPAETPKTRLQQYQREMVMHASFAASALVRGKAAAVAAQSSKTGSSSSLDLVALAHAQLGKHKPVSPRLHPLGSPGPVTPMDLECHNTDGYLGARPVGPDSHRETEEIANALRAEEERRKREGASSPMGQVKM